MMTAAQVHGFLPGSVLVGDGAVSVQRVHTDSRTLSVGDLFVALKGEKFDANAFLPEAVAKGAAVLLCHPKSLPDAAIDQVPRIEVADATRALGALATQWRKQFSVPLIAVTGSNGKTTVTQMLASILQAAHPDGGSLATQGNLNNEIGVPMTLLRLRAEHRRAVVELGMNHPGEIALLAAMAQPTVALVNNAQREHLEFMHTIEAVARENGSVIAAVGAAGVAVFPHDDAYAPLWRSLAGERRVVTFAMAGAGDANSLVCRDAQWWGSHWAVRAEGMGVELEFALHIAGKHNVQNALAAAACALSAGVSAAAVQTGLAQFSPVKGRSRAMALTIGGKDITLVDDTYNANPDSVRAAIDVLAELPGPRLLVLGDMGEVGSQGPQFHAEAGRYAKSRGIESFMALGVLSQSAVDAFPGAQHFDAMDALKNAVTAALPQMRSVLVKGSRFMRMEQVVEEMSCS
ncbi:MAG: UDP-N-acetylmuramoyl-tripeptide--D-alanyl-D-alanine ligase [Rhodoferax sp.]|nr:UDP-N-acetylmuramoyl-tripeptide--D-alanyl-D-alanine ligase [Rhodoferax sp.]